MALVTFELKREMNTREEQETAVIEREVASDATIHTARGEKDQLMSSS